MIPTQWVKDNFPKTIKVGRLKLPRGQKLALLLTSGGYDGARLQICRHNPGLGEELLIVAVDVGLGQRPTVNDVRSWEPIALRFGMEDTLPSAFSLRGDFPTDVPHLNVVPVGQPRTFCLYNVQPHEVSRTYTALRFIERVRWWLRETAYGRLHGDDQPLDPLFHQVGLGFILPTNYLAQQHAAYVAVPTSDRPWAPYFLEPVSAASLGRLAVAQSRAFATIAVTNPPIKHGRMRNLPTTLDELLTAFQSLGIELRALLSEAFLRLLTVNGHGQLLQRRLLILISTPLLRDGESGKAEAIAINGFVTPDTSSGEVAVSIGALLNAAGAWAKPLAPVNPTDLSTIKVVPVDIYTRFDRPLARQASGKVGNAISRLALIGVGALGSQVALTAARMGYGRWTLVDEDFLLPHNLARHGLTASHLGQAKADAVAAEMRALLGPDAATAIVTDAIGPGDEGQQWPTVLTETDFIIDASASISVAHWLAIDAQRNAPASSCFLNPGGSDAVILSEGDARSPRLDHLEISYYWRLVVDNRLAGHLREDSSTLAVGACRSPTAQIPQTRILPLAALTTEALCDAPWPADGRIIIWRISEAGIARHTFAGETYASGQLRDWTVLVRKPLLDDVKASREKAGSVETGGILAGTWDRARKIIYVAGHFDPPPDSKHEATGFVRGTVGVFRTITEVENSTLSNLTYIGEWHTHPPGYISQPSSDDRKLLRWVRDALEWSDAPGLILVAGDDGFRIVLLDEGKQYSECVIPSCSAP